MDTTESSVIKFCTENMTSELVFTIGFYVTDRKYKIQWVC